MYSSNTILIHAKYSSVLEFSVPFFIYSIAIRGFSGGTFGVSKLLPVLYDTEKSLHTFLCAYYLLFP